MSIKALSVSVYKQVWVEPRKYALFMAENVPLAKLAEVEALFHIQYHANISQSINAGIVVIPEPMKMEEYKVNHNVEANTFTLTEANYIKFLRID